MILGRSWGSLCGLPEKFVNFSTPCWGEMIANIFAITYSSGGVVALNIPNMCNAVFLSKVLEVLVFTFQLCAGIHRQEADCNERFACIENRDDIMQAVFGKLLLEG